MTPLLAAITLRHGYPGWFFFLMLFACVLLITYFYINNSRSLPRAYFAFLFILRLLIVAVLLLFIFQPEVTFTRYLTRKPSLLVLLDTSRSMSHADPETGVRLDLARTNLKHTDFLSKLEEQFDVGLYQFGATAEPLRRGDLADVEADADLTDLATSGEVAFGQRRSDSVAGIILLSDGVDNGGKRPLKTLSELGVPIYPVGFGIRIEEQEHLRNVALVDVDYDDFVPKDNTTQVTVDVDAQGYGHRPARIVFRDKKKDKELASQELVLDTKKSAQRVVLKFTPKEKGRLEGVVEVEELPGEVRLADNRRSVTINVTGPRIKVLYIEGVLRWEGRFLMRTLQEDPNVDLLYLVKAAEGEFLERSNLKGITLKAIPNGLQVWKRFDVIILGDVHRSLFSQNQLADIKQAVLDGRGLLLMGGVAALGPGKYTGTPIEELSPVWFGTSTIGQENGEFIWRLTDDGVVHPIFSGIAQFFATGDGEAETPLHQKLAGCTRVGRAKPLASILAVHPTARGRDGKPLAVIAAQNAGSGHAMVVTADTTHRWYLPNRALGRENPYVKFWGQTIRWLASEEVKRDDKPGITAYTDKAEYEPNHDVRFLALVRDPRGQATSDASVYVSIIGPSKELTKDTLTKVDGKLGEYRGTFRPASPGPYEVVFEARLGEETLGERQTVKFTVGKPDLEMENLDLDEAFLKKLADATRGRYYTWLGLNELAASLTAEQEGNIEQDRFPKYDGWQGHVFTTLVLVFFIAAAGCEWYLRKRIQLA